MYIYYSTSGLQLSCSSTRQNSLWNFVSSPDSNWSSVGWISWNQFPEGWHSNGYSGEKLQIVESGSEFTLDWNSCGAPVPVELISQSQKIAVNTSNGMFTFRKTVSPLVQCGGGYLQTPVLQANNSTETDDSCIAGNVTCCVRLKTI